MNSGPQSNRSSNSHDNSSSLESFDRIELERYAAIEPTVFSQWAARWDRFLMNEGQKVAFLGFWSTLQLLIFFFSMQIYERSIHFQKTRSILGSTLGISRGAAAVLNFDCSLILFSVCRNLISLLRSTFLNSIIPFDKNELLHRTLGWSIVVFSVIHTLAHYVNYFRLQAEALVDKERKAAEGPELAGNGMDRIPHSVWYMAFVTGPGLTGHILALILILMVVTSMERVRRKSFETFWYIHHLCVFFFITLMYHGAFCFVKADLPPYCKTSPASYKFILASLLFYTSERILREVCARRPTSITKVVLHPSKVVEVQIKKTVRGGRGIKPKAGQYVFLNCPDISFFEWHPFTITSAPEEDYISVHIRVTGDWTTAFARRLGCSFDDQRQHWIEELMGPGPASESEKRKGDPDLNADAATSTEIITLPRLLLDGPYGSPSEDAFDYEITVLVGAGIGVTPFASVLKHIWYSVMQPTKVITLRKVYFFWVCRDRDAFEWFQDLLIALEEQDISDFLEIRSYLTGEIGMEDLNTILEEARATARHQQKLRRQLSKESKSSSSNEGVTGHKLWQQKKRESLAAAAAAATEAARHLHPESKSSSSSPSALRTNSSGLHHRRQLSSTSLTSFSTKENEENNVNSRAANDQSQSDLNCGTNLSEIDPISTTLKHSPLALIKDTTIASARLIRPVSSVSLSPSPPDRDAITGLRSPTYYGRPNFDKIFGDLALAHPPEQGQVGVFFCGPKPLGKTLNRCAKKFKFHFHTENF